MTYFIEIKNTNFPETELYINIKDIISVATDKNPNNNNQSKIVLKDRTLYDNRTPKEFINEVKRILTKNIFED